MAPPQDGTQEHILVVVGSGGVGKSCMTVRFLKDEFTSEYDPTIEENYRKKVEVDDTSAILHIIDTAGQQEYRALRDQQFDSGEGFLLVFALNDSNTFQEVKELRESIVKLKGTKNVPFVVVGNKCDLGEDEREVKRDEAQEYCAKIKSPYIETSAKTNINVTAAYHELVREVRKSKKSKKSSDPVPEKSKKKGGDKKSKCIIL